MKSPNAALPLSALAILVAYVRRRIIVAGKRSVKHAQSHLYMRYNFFAHKYAHTG